MIELTCAFALGLSGALAPAPSEAEAPTEEASAPAPSASAGIEAVDLAPSEAPAPEAAPAPGPSPDAGQAQPQPRAQPQSPMEAAATAPPMQAPPPRVDAPPRAGGTGVAAAARPTKPKRPITWRAQLSPSLGSTIAPHHSYQLFDTQDRAMAHRGVAAFVDHRLASPLVFLGGGLAYRYLGTEANDLFARTDSELDIHEGSGFLRLALSPFEGLDAYLQAGGGPSFMRYVLWDDAPMRGKGVTFVADGLAGLELSLPRRWLSRRGSPRATAGLDLAAGYTLRGAMPIEPTMKLDEDPIPTDMPELGELRASGFTWRAGVFVRFF